MSRNWHDEASLGVPLDESGPEAAILLVEILVSAAEWNMANNNFHSQPSVIRLSFIRFATVLIETRYFNQHSNERVVNTFIYRKNIIYHHLFEKHINITHLENDLFGKTSYYFILGNILYGNRHYPIILMMLISNT